MLNVGIIGLGHMGRLHMMNCLHVDDVRVVAAADSSKKAFEYLIQCDAKGYGVESEQLVLAARNGLRVMEVPISVNYKGLARTSKKFFLLHGADLVSTLFRLVVEERPLMYLGLPGIGITLIGATLGLYLLWMFNITRYFSIPVAVLTVGASIVGALLVIAAITLHGLKRINEKLNRLNKKLTTANINSWVFEFSAMHPTDRGKVKALRSLFKETMRLE